MYNTTFPEMPIIEGVQLNAVSAGIKKNNSPDLVLFRLPPSATAAGVFTQNAFCAAPVTLCKKHLQQMSHARYLLINSGNANACTGDRGFHDALATCTALAQATGVEVNQVLPFSTGVIGEPLAVDRIVKALPALISGLHEGHWLSAAEGIMTTDTGPKGATAGCVIEGETITVNGIAKGAGMIRPDMATMLAYIVTNASISAHVLNQLIREATDQSFNRITIDGDTSTNDSAMLAATGGSAITIDEVSSPHYPAIRQCVIQVFQQLAQAIVRDGEGATKFVTITVEEGATGEECLQVAFAIAHSPLVKTALFASDSNWGRIVAAIGNAGLEQLDASKVRVFLGDVLIVEQGGRADSWREEDGQRVMKQTEIILRVCLGRGQQSDRVWTTDLSYDYVKINAEYRT